MATIQELLLIGKEKLDQSQNEYSKYERKVLLENVLGCNYMYMLMNGEEEVSLEQEQQYMALIKKRCEHYPLQYLLGYANFMDYTFYVDEHVLIPRNDTEVLVELVSNQLDNVLSKGLDKKNQRILDLCCGSGCIGISLKLYHNEISLTLSDVSEDALKVTKRNLEKYDIKAKVICDNLLDGIDEQQDFIVSNPPYIESQVINTLMPEVKEFEPMLALDGGKDGLDFYREIVIKSLSCLREGGWLFFEIGYNQGEAVSSLMKKQGFQDVEIRKDYANLDRVVYGHL